MKRISVSFFWAFSMVAALHAGAQGRDDNLDLSAGRAGGHAYHGERSASALGQALYMAVQARYWSAVRALLVEYRLLPDRDPLLLHYAQGLLARGQGQLGTAEAELRTLLSIQQGFLPARLELARVLFESGQDLEAVRMFSDIYARLDLSETTAGVRKTVAQYLETLARRQAWSASVTFGVRWADNINRSSASRACLLQGEAGICLVERTLPSRIGAGGADLEASVRRRFPLGGQHGINLRMHAYGIGYFGHGQYDETTLVAQLGYGHHAGSRQLSVAPRYTHNTVGGKAFYETWGLHAAWRYLHGVNSLIRLEGETKHSSYRPRIYARYLDGFTHAIYASYIRDIGAGRTLFGGVDVERSLAKEDTQGYFQHGARLGASVHWHGFTGTLQASYRHRRYGAYNALLEARRRDIEQAYAFELTADRWRIMGFTPSLTLRHSKIGSNVSWLYAHDRREVGVSMAYKI
ncbi:surface lipoprotein assembly modifier [Allopusillimonas soli]|uniref:DUF560 domain-containing protein n=1 Tax=Allopusillimonas soli TaxID=659016 RepID=A0A853F5R1_9BURK|nr:surface lipoprotein assembly modifier [Allopusillimonas soli]NYT35319.1 DUF560 domain-containing protein [Allopusillimonas soli]